MKNQSNNQNGIMSSIGNAEAIQQRETANKTSSFSATFLFPSNTSWPQFGSNRVTVNGWMNIQQLENQLRDIGCKVELLTSFMGTYYTVS